MNKKNLLDEVNSLRTNPSAYTSKVSQYKGYFNFDILKMPDGRNICTEEGPAAYDEAINYLKNAKPLNALTPSKGLTKIAEDVLAKVQSLDADLVNKVTDLTSMINKQGIYEGTFVRVMQFGGTSPDQVIIDLIVSDGDKSRRQRENLFNKDIKVCGIAFGDHKDFKKVVIILGAGGFRNKNEANDADSY